MCCLGQIQEATHHKAEAVRSLVSHLRNHQRQTCWTQLFKKRQLISDILPWNPTHEQTSVGETEDLHQLHTATG